jgi:hypothetical protein
VGLEELLAGGAAHLVDLPLHAPLKIWLLLHEDYKGEGYLT